MGPIQSSFEVYTQVLAPVKWKLGMRPRKRSRRGLFAGLQGAAWPVPLVDTADRRGAEESTGETPEGVGEWELS